jgi:hypothetical protein
MERLTVLLACNADGGDKLTPFVVGKSQNPKDVSICMKVTIEA